MLKIIDEIREERVRQIEKEGWTLEHDDSHTEGEMALAAACCSHEFSRPSGIERKIFSPSAATGQNEKP